MKKIIAFCAATCLALALFACGQPGSGAAQPPTGVPGAFDVSGLAGDWSAAPDSPEAGLTLRFNADGTGQYIDADGKAVDFSGVEYAASVLGGGEGIRFTLAGDTRGYQAGPVSAKHTPGSGVITLTYYMNGSDRWVALNRK